MKERGLAWSKSRLAWRCLKRSSILDLSFSKKRHIAERSAILTRMTQEKFRTGEYGVWNITA